MSGRVEPLGQLTDVKKSELVVDGFPRQVQPTAFFDEILRDKDCLFQLVEPLLEVMR